MNAGPALPACPACGGGPLRFWRLARASDRCLAGRASYRLARCPDCATAALVAEQVAEDDQRLYEEGTYARPARLLDAFVDPLRRLARRERLRYVPVPDGARIFEVGAGDGAFLGALAAAGHAVAGVEPYQQLRNERAPVLRATLDEVELPPASQDAIVLWHVLEHLEDPAAALDRVGPWLKAEGTLVVAVPNLASLQARVGGDRWFHQDIPRHRVQFTRRGITGLLTRCGFRVERVGSPLLDQNLLGMWQTLLNRVTIEPDVFFRLVKGNPPHASRALAVRDAAVTALLGPPLVPLAALLEVVAGRLGRGGALVLHAVRAQGA